MGTNPIIMEHNPIIMELLEAGVEVKLALVESPYAHKCVTVVYRVMCFYKQNYDYVDLHSKMFFDGEGGEAHGFISHHADCSETEEIRALDDIVNLNYNWWLREVARMEQYGQTQDPDPAWATLYEEFGLVKKETITRYVPVVPGED